MIKILHAADLHLDSPMAGYATDLKDRLRGIPAMLLSICRQEQCDLVLLAGDLFDGAYNRESLNALRDALKEMAVPVFISPGNHDFMEPGSPYWEEPWPENVHIFTHPMISAVNLPELDCKIYGAGFRGMDCGSLLEGFHAEGEETYHIGLLHGDPTQANSPYNPITAAQVRDSGLQYLALGHIHKAGNFRAGSTLCAWPGCPMGRGFDELGQKGVLLVTLDESVQIRFFPLEVPQFHDLYAEAGVDPLATVEALLPAAGNENYYRITLTGECAGVDLPGLTAKFSRFPHLELRDKTTAPVDLWEAAGEDTLEGVYFGLLHQALEGADELQRKRILLAARLSRRILDGQEVMLP